MARRRKKQKSRAWIWGLGIVLLMVFSGLGYMLDSSNAPNNYNGYKFTAMQNSWAVKIDGRQMQFAYHPGDLESIEVDADAIQKLKSATVFYVTYDPNSDIISEMEVARIRLQKEFGNVLPGVLNQTGGYENFELINCQNASQYVPVLVLEQGNSTSITSDEYCIHVSARDRYEVTAAIERLLYGIYGVM